MSRYAWVIDTDHIFDRDEDGITDKAWGHDPFLPDEAGTIGPRDAPQELVDALTRGEGRRFQIRDDDDILYYSGRFIGPTDDADDVEQGYGPLQDFGAPNAGATDIYYDDGNGGWALF